jgi:hypothetical protein
MPRFGQCHCVYLERPLVTYRTVARLYPEAFGRSQRRFGRPVDTAEASRRYGPFLCRHRPQPPPRPYPLTHRFGADIHLACKHEPERADMSFGGCPGDSGSRGLAGVRPADRAALRLRIGPRLYTAIGLGSRGGHIGGLTGARRIRGREGMEMTEGRAPCLA